MNTIRNFAIIAHVDHGKSTLADRLLELTGTISKEGHEDQLLDRNPISRERGITIKLAPVQMIYRIMGEELRIKKDSSIHNSNTLILNLIDTPGHVDFSYEVDRTLSCVEGVVLLVDATQGIQAQTIANAYKAIEKNLAIIPVVNKIDMPNAQVPETKKDLMDFLGIQESEIYAVSAKTGEGVAALLDAIVSKIPHPNNPFHPGSEMELLQALIFDSYFDPHKGVIAFVRVFDGAVQKNTKLRLAAANKFFETTEVGIFTPELVAKESLAAGDIGYIVTNLKDIHEVRVGDTIILEKSPEILYPGYRQVKSMVYASMFPTETVDYLNLKKALEKLYLNDSSLEFTAIHSRALGPGFRVGFLGLLHADVVRERLEREYDLDLVLTPPQVEYESDGHNYKEPIIKLMLVFPQEYTGPVMQLCENYRGTFMSMDNKHQTSVVYEMPMSEMISDFFDRLKSVSSGYASLDWELVRFQDVKADKLNILLNLEPVEEFSEVVVAERAQEKATELVKKLKEVIPRQQYEVKIQAQFKGKIIASERISAFRKDVTAKLYGGDRTRKDKLLKKQKAGKKLLKMVGRVEIPKEAFMKMFNKSS